MKMPKLANDSDGNNVSGKMVISEISERVWISSVFL